MKICAVTMVKNEADIIEAFVRHNLKFVDAITILVHGPTDATVEVLNALAREGLRIELLKDQATGYLQAPRMTWLAHSAFASGADFVFPLDADEMIIAPSRASLETTLASIDSKDIGCRYLMRHYVPQRDDPSDEMNPIVRLRYRLRDEHLILHKVVLTNKFAADPGRRLNMGNHSVWGFPPLPELACLYLAHYPIRTPAQFANKVIVGYLAHIAVGYPPTVEQGNATHWRDWYETLVSDPELLDKDFPGLAARYHKVNPGQDLLWDPIASDLELRYTVPSHSAPLSVLARFTEQLIRNLQGTPGQGSSSN